MASNSLSGNVEVKRREKKDESRGSVQASEPSAQPVILEDGRCTCCPYGYHIDLDFLNFCENITNGSALSNLKRIQRTKRKLRKSMELMLQQQQHIHTTSSVPAPTPPPDVVNSTEASRLIHMVNYEQTATNQVLQDIDSAVNATLASIDSMQHSKSQPLSHRYMSSDSEDSFGYSPISPLSASSVAPQQFQFDNFPVQPPPPPPRRSSLRYAHQCERDDTMPGRKDSMSSLSSVSTISSEQVLGGGPHTAHSFESSTVPSHPEAHHQISAMTSEALAATTANHFSQREQDGPSSSMSPNTTISKASLAAMKEAMAVSLQRMRDLEDQVKAIPILQVRISVLKEEKRLLSLQMKAKSSNISTWTVGVSEDTVDSPFFSSSRSFTYPAVASSCVPLRSPTMKTPSPTLSKPSSLKTVGVGEHSVLEPYLLQPSLSTGYSEVQSEIQSKSYGKKSCSDVTGHHHEDTTEAECHKAVQSRFSINHIRPNAPRPATRSIGVGLGDVNAQTLQILNREVRTVIIGANSATTGKRNVGIEVKVPSRSVGVSFSSEDVQPTTRTIGMNVTCDSSENSVRVDARGESELRTALQNMLQQEVHSIGTDRNFQPTVMEMGVQREPATLVSVGCGAEDQGMDVIPQPAVHHCCVGTLTKTDTLDQSVCTDRDWVTDTEVSTVTVETCDKFVSTDSCLTETMFTSTELLCQTESSSQTDKGVFEKMEVVKSTGSMISTSSNTTAVTINTDHLTDNKGPLPDSLEVVDKQYNDTAVNTSSRKLQLSFSRVECLEICGDVPAVKAAPKRSLTMQEQIIQRGADQAFAFLGSTSSSGSPSLTNPKNLPLLTCTEGAHLSARSQNTHFRQTDEKAGACADDCFGTTKKEVNKSIAEGATACVQSSELGQSLPEGQDLVKENILNEKIHFSALDDNLQNVSRRRLDDITETLIIKQSSGSRLSRHRNSNGGRISQELGPNRQGIFSGRRVGSVEDFMPDEMRRLMNINTIESEKESQTSRASSSSSLSKRTVSKTAHTVITKQTSQDSTRRVSITKTIIGPDGSDTTTEQDNDLEDVHHEGKGLGKLSMGQLDLSQTAGEDDSLQEDNVEDISSPSEGSEAEGIKDSGYDDSTTVNNLVESNSLQGLDLASMGSLERRELKSIMKTSKSDSGNPKKGISFADSVVGGTGSSSEEEGTESDEESTTSYEEGSYDGREGDITYQCQDDEAIAQGLPGAKMYDQNIRETYELSEEMYRSCQVLANYLVDSTTIQTKELNANLSVVQEEWFRVSSHKLSNVHQVEDYLSSINEISHRLLEYIVNLVDNNGNAAIHYCVSHCNFDIVGLLLDTEVCNMQKPNKAGYTPAMLASLAYIQNDHHRDIIRQLFTAGDINTRAEKVLFKENYSLQ